MSVFVRETFGGLEKMMWQVPEELKGKLKSELSQYQHM